MIEPERKSIRLKDYDYTRSGMYFVTVCCEDHKLYFQNHPDLSAIVEEEWENIADRFTSVQTDCFVIMPNHIHGIIGIQKPESVGATLAVARAGARPAPTLGDVVGSFKSICITRWLKTIKDKDLSVKGKFWQRNYYEHVIRNEKELNSIREYIINNPLRWQFDRENQQGTPDKDELDFWTHFQFEKERI